mgnify:CR=1 FL=1
MKKVNVILMVLVLVFALAACEGTDKPITVAMEATGEIPEKFEEQMTRFTEETGIEVKIQTYAGAENYEQALLGQIAGGTAPDVFILDGGHKIREYASEGALLALGDILEMDMGNFEQSLVEAFYYEDELYGVPKDYNTSVLFYHADLLDGDVPTTISEFETAAMNATSGTGDEKVYGFGIDPKINYYLPYIFTMGAEILGADGSVNEAEMQSQEHKNALQLLKDLFDGGYATSPFLSGAGWDGEIFGNKDVALLYGGSWITGVIGEGFNAGVAELPTEGNASSMLYVAGWVISSQSENPEDAARLIEFLSTDDELVQGNLDGLIGLPPTMSAMDALIEEKSDDPYLPVYREVVKDGFPFGSIDPEFVDTYNQALESMLYDGVSVDDTIAAMLAE